MSDDLTALTHFGGIARLFPLPNLVLFPQAMQALHIFEPRYRQMTADALAGDRLIALALLRPGWEPDYEKVPPIYPVVCLGRIVADQRLEDGRYHLLLRGLSRAGIVEEVPTDRLYRSARVRLLADANPPPPQREPELRRHLMEMADRWFAPPHALAGQLQKLVHGGLDLGMVCDVFGYALPLDVAFKQQLLETLDVSARVRRLLDYLREQTPPTSQAEADRPFPPTFSAN
jgi:Lon protease-like protein